MAVQRVFVSYKTEDRPRAAAIVQVLQDAGITTWWDQDIEPGQGWRQSIEENLAAADLCLVLWSAASAGREGHWVKEEAEHAKQTGKYLGVMIDPIIPPFGFAELQSVQATRWDNDGKKAAHEALLLAIAGFGSEISRPAPDAAPVQAAPLRRQGRRIASNIVFGIVGLSGVITLAIVVLLIVDNLPHENKQKSFTIIDKSAQLSPADVQVTYYGGDKITTIQVLGKYPKGLPTTDDDQRAGRACQLDANGKVISSIGLDELTENKFSTPLAMGDGFNFQGYFTIDKGKADGLKSLYVGFPVKGRDPCEVHTPDLLPFLDGML